MHDTESNIIIYNTIDGKASVALYAKDGKIWLNQKQLAELFATSVPNINIHISNILKDNELEKESVIKDYLITASDGKNYNVTFYSLEMILAVGYRVKGKRGTQFRQWATRHLSEYLVKERFYQKLRDLFALSSDYELREKATQMFFAETQNKLLYAVTHVNNTYDKFDTRRKYLEAVQADQEDLKLLDEIVDRTKRS